MLDFTSLRILLKALRELHGQIDRGEDIQANVGLCSAVSKIMRRDLIGSLPLDVDSHEGYLFREALSAWASLRDDWFATWEHFSGSETYPVPATDPDLAGDAYPPEISAQLQYDRNNRGCHYGCWHGEQLHLRTGLLAHCINKLTGLLPEGQAVS